MRMRGGFVMELDEIRKRWKSRSRDGHKAAKNIWDSVADYYAERELPQWQNDDFLRLLDDTVLFSTEMKSLDIGCGAGDYSIRLAPKVKQACGTDLAPAMIKAARKKAALYHAPNTSFICADWSFFDIDQAGWRGAYDLVFAHMTPAIDSAAALEKMMACSRRYCFLTKPTRRSDSVLDAIKRQLGLPGGSEFDKHIGEAFELIWQMGACPQLSYRQDIWQFENSLEEAWAWYTGKIKTQRQITSAEEALIREYLRKIAVDGRIQEETKTTIVTMYWQV